ncbi:thiamine-phosphate kinase [Sphingomonas sp. CFBP8993]|uniref:thiamine-phosphate kinase n=1 Tax=Sphingomonas sp. CFBP8993 TaxID=3096526 RepID=UPI002A6AB7BA|nr:thiamine-phosphate kinase [Sphingomonas sp. CFBP8993]MDY0957810.1 thiamine-phosphate kinase [Sphingomonas sp. CFBP8993]
MTEAEFIAALRRMPLHPGARGLVDDSAVLTAAPLVVTTDTLVEGVHFLPHDPPADVAWKLVATNLSDLAAKGALVEGVMLNYPLGDTAWDRAFLDGLATVLARFHARLIGGDTVSRRGPRTLTLTAFGRDAPAPSRDGARAGDALWVTGTIGDAGLGLAIAQGGHGPVALRDAYRRPFPRLTEGRALGPVVHAMMDVSDGLLIDAGRMARASGLAVTIALDAIPLSDDARAFGGTDRAARLTAATAGDDYELLFALPSGIMPPVAATRVGRFSAGDGLTLTDAGQPVALPARWGYEHRSEG